MRIDGLDLKWRLCFLWILPALFSLAHTQPDRAKQSPDSTATTARTKASWLPKFLIYTNWPPNGLGKDGSVVIGILGQESGSETVSSILREIEGNSRLRIKGKTLRVVRFGAFKEDWKPNCHLLYITRSEQPNTSRIVTELKNRPILTIADFRDFIDKGGMIGLHTDSEQVLFDINQIAAKRAGLQIRTPILSMAARLIRQSEN